MALSACCAGLSIALSSVACLELVVQLPVWCYRQAAAYLPVATCLCGVAPGVLTGGPISHPTQPRPAVSACTAVPYAIRSTCYLLPVGYVQVAPQTRVAFGGRGHAKKLLLKPS
jgi:hypothetical protein